MSTIKIFTSEFGLNNMNVSDLSDPKNEQYFMFTTADMNDIGYTQVGTGTVNCTFFTRDEVQKGAIDSLKAQVQKVKAEAEKEVTKLNDKIQQLLAITNEA
jgi:hypothetical protein